MVPIAAADWAQITMTVMATTGPVAGARAGAGAAAAVAVEVVDAPLRRIIHVGAMAAALAFGSAEVNLVALVEVAMVAAVEVVGECLTDQVIYTTVAVEGAIAAGMTTEVAVVLKGFVVHTTIVPRPQESSTGTSCQHRREMHQTMAIDRTPSNGPS